MIMVSGNDPSEDDRKTFFQAGAEDFWVKPLSARQIELLTKASVDSVDYPCGLPGVDYPV